MQNARVAVNAKPIRYLPRAKTNFIVLGSIVRQQYSLTHVPQSY
jgi:hypothetical protein